jgi:3-oxoacyl-[acyl-carrier protein] reductase
MLLKDKNAVIYGAGGAIGGAVSRAFAREGARVFLVGRTLATLDTVANDISNAGGKAETAQVDALDKQSIEAHLSNVQEKFGGVDISLNVISLGDAQGIPLVNMTADHFNLPVTTAVTTHFLTATAAARHMVRKRSGVILALTANAARKPYPVIGGFGVACAAIEGICRQLALELGPHDIRVVCLRSAGSPDAPGVSEAFNIHAKAAGQSREEWEAEFAKITLLHRLPKLAEVANAAVLAASDYASAMTGAVVNVTCGELVD